MGIDYLSIATLDHIVDAHVALLGHVSAWGGAGWEQTEGWGAANAVREMHNAAGDVDSHSSTLGYMPIKGFGLPCLINTVHLPAPPIHP